MNKQEVIRKIEQAYGAFITRKEIATFMNYKDPRSIDPMLHELPKVNGKYFVNDVATAIIERMKWS